MYEWDVQNIWFENANILKVESTRNYIPEWMWNEGGIPPSFAVEGSSPVFAISCSEIRSIST
jgi:hypothetical protein